MNLANKIIQIVLLIVAVFILLVWFNGSGLKNYPIKGTQLDIALTNQIMKDGQLGTVLVKKEASQSISYIVDWENSNEQGIVIYVKSLYSNRWRLDYYYTSGTQNETVKYVPSTQIVAYPVMCTLNTGSLPIITIGETTPVIINRVFQISIIFAAWIIGRMIGLSRHRKKYSI